MPPSAADGHRLPAHRAGTPEPAPPPGTATTTMEAGAEPAPTCAAGSPALLILAALLEDAARRAARTWAGLPGQQDRDLAVSSLAEALADLCVFITRLAACFRLRAMDQPGPETHARAARIHAAAGFLGQARLVLAHTRAGIPPEPGRDLPAGLLHRATERAAAWPQPSAAPGEETLHALAAALSTLADGTSALAAPAGEPQAAVLNAVRACINAAARQLNPAAPPAPAPRAMSCSGQPG